MPRARSEYMQQFCPVGGRWDEASQCYQSRVEYRRGRRMLEHAHVPLLWDLAHGDSDSSDGSGGHSPARCASPEKHPDVQPREGDGQSHRLDDAEGLAASLQLDRSQQDQGMLLDEQEAKPATAPAAERLHKKGTRKKMTVKQDSANKETQAPGSYLHRRNKTDVQSASGSCQRVASSRHDQTTAPHVSKNQRPQSLFTRTTHPRPPFLSYGWANTALETGKKKTHNILPSSSQLCAALCDPQIHESAIKAMHKRKNARLQIKKKKVHLAEKQREHLHSLSDIDNPWLTEYQRSYSARTI